MDSAFLLLCLCCIAMGNARLLSKNAASEQLHNAEGAFEEERIQIGDPIGPSSFAGALVYYERGYYLGPFCTSTLISPDRVLTAAHCFTPDMAKFEFKFVFGLSDLRLPSLTDNANNPNVSIIPFAYPADFKPHRGYIGGGDMFQHDIAIIQLPVPVTAANMKPIKLARKEYNTSLFDVGWGRKDCANASIETLRRARGFLLTNEQCNLIWQPNRNGIPFYNSQLCALFVTDATVLAAVASGDSGGPLFDEGPEGLVQIGVTSHVMHTLENYYNALQWRCTNAYIPQVFTRVSSYEGWIKERAPEAQFV